MRAAPSRRCLCALALLAFTGCNRPHAAENADAPADQSPKPAGGRPVRIEQITLASGLVIEDMSVGTGDMCLPDSRVRVRYICRLGSTNGPIVDSSGDNSVEWHLPRMIKAWQEGMPGMRVGGRRRLTAPPHLGYGSRSVRDAQGIEVIPPGSTLVYDIDLLALTAPATPVPPPAPPPATNQGE